MATLCTTEKQILEKLFQMGGGYVLNFSNETMRAFFANELNLDIYAPAYNCGSGSKANRMRGFWDTANDNLVGKTILKLIEYIEGQITIGQIDVTIFPNDIIEKGKAIGQKLLDAKVPPPISEVTRRGIFDEIGDAWSGRLGDVGFLHRIYNLESLPSTDVRDPYSKNAVTDIYQHRINNNDWPSDWILNDSRFNLIHSKDEEFIRFLCETLHPVVCPDTTEAMRLLAIYNRYLRVDGWEIAQHAEMSGKPIFAGRRCLDGMPVLETAKAIVSKIDAEYITKQVTRMQNAIDTDPELAIGTAKEFVETICKTILCEYGEDVSGVVDLTKLVKQVLKHLELLPDNIPETSKGSDTIKRTLSNLCTVAQGLAEIRNLYGSGHGKAAQSKGLSPRHARLAVGAATTLAMFLFETYHDRKASTTPSGAADNDKNI